MTVKPIPEDYHTATPYLAIKNTAGATEFYKKAFNASELVHLVDRQPDQKDIPQRNSETV